MINPIKAICTTCKDTMVSEEGGHFVTCKCSESFLDRDRWFPDRVRLGGAAKLIEETKP